MITELTDLPSPLIGFEASGKLHAEDYRDVLLPAIEKAASSGDVRIVLVMPEFDGISAGAVWQDLKMGIEKFHAWKRIALVTDVEWMARGVDVRLDDTGRRQALLDGREGRRDQLGEGLIQRSHTS